MNEWKSVTEEELEMMVDLLGVEAEEPLPETELVRDLKAIGQLIGVNAEDL